jgi:tellurite resistance protein TerB
MFESFTDFLKQTRAGLEATVARFNNKVFLNAVVAACARVAAADGNISTEEKQKMLGFIQISPALKVFSTADVLSAWNDNITFFDFDATIGHTESNKVIAQLKGNTEACETLVQVCCVIGASDGDFDDQEKAVVREIANLLGLSPSKFGL